MTPSLAHTAACIPSHAQQGFLDRKSQRVRAEGRSEEHLSERGQSGRAMDAPEKQRLGEEVSSEERRWYLKRAFEHYHRLHVVLLWSLLSNVPLMQVTLPPDSSSHFLGCTSNCFSELFPYRQLPDPPVL